MLKEQKTSMIRKEDLNAEWFLIDASSQTLGRLATQISVLLQGKNKVSYTPHLNCGDNVVVVNVEKIVLTGNKWKQKKYYSHSNYPGGLKQRTALDLFTKNPVLLVKKAVERMLPKNKLQSQRMSHLFLYVGVNHPHQGQNPVLLR